MKTESFASDVLTTSILFIVILFNGIKEYFDDGMAHAIANVIAGFFVSLILNYIKNKINAYIRLKRLRKK